MASKKVLIIGGGISGITVALELAELGIPTTLVEQEPSLGGLSASLACKASEVCNKCFACVVDKRISEIEKSQAISALTQTHLAGIRKGPGGFQASLRRGEEPMEIDAAAVVIAAGVDPYEASQKEEYGYGRYKNVITARDLEERLRSRGTLSRPSDDLLPTTIAFFQCVGSRDESIGKLYCSHICCAYALRLIRSIRHVHPDVAVTFLYLDIQPSGASFLPLLNACRQDKGIRFIRSLPSKVYASPLSSALRVRFVDPQREDVVEETFDLIVLSVGMVLRKKATSLVELFGLTFTEDGFLRSAPGQPGIFVTGACTGPKGIDQSILQAKSTALQVWQYLQREAR